MPLGEPALDRALVAYAMNGQPLPFLNGFPVRLVVPGYFATYWIKMLYRIRVLDGPDDGFWMDKAYPKKVSSSRGCILFGPPTPPPGDW